MSLFSSGTSAKPSASPPPTTRHTRRSKPAKEWKRSPDDYWAERLFAVVERHKGLCGLPYTELIWEEIGEKSRRAFRRAAAEIRKEMEFDAMTEEMRQQIGARYQAELDRMHNESIQDYYDRKERGEAPLL